MRILHWCELYRPSIGGVEILVEQLSTALLAGGDECIVVTGHSAADLPDFEVIDAVPVHRFRFQHALASGDGAAVAKLRREVRDLVEELSPDLVHLHTLQPSLFFYESSLARRPPTVLTVHEPWGSPDPRRSLAVRAMKRADGLVAVSLTAAQRLAADLPELTARIRAIPNGLPQPCAEAATGVDEGRTNTMPSDPEPPPLIVAAGRLVTEKGFDTLLAAMPAVLQGFPKARLQIAGDGPERSALQQLIEDLDLAEQVELLGWLRPDRIENLLAAATVVVVPSRWDEPFGLVALQAAQLARALVVTDAGALPEIVLDGECGLVVARESPEPMAAALLDLLASPARREDLGRAAAARAQAQYSMDRMVADYRRLYAQLGVTS